MLPKREAQRHKDAFEFYYSMPKRSLVKLAKRYHVSAATTATWSRAFDWAGRIAARDERVREKREENAVNKAARYLEKLEGVANAMMVKGVEPFRKESPKACKSIIEAAQVVTVADKLMRTALGMPDQTVEHSGGVKVIFEDVKTDASSNRRKAAD